MEDADQAIEELTFVLLYLTSWKEADGLYASWRGYDFGALDRLEEKDLVVRRSRGAKSVFIREDAFPEARRLLEKYGIGDPKRRGAGARGPRRRGTQSIL